MSIFYPYNEILPKKTAHDVYIFHECVAFAKLFEIILAIGKDSSTDAELCEHYLGLRRQLPKELTLLRLPIVRKNNWFKFSWNFVFFYYTQKKIAGNKPDFVFLSVLKAAAFHLRRKVPGVRYVYEVHELSCYSEDEGKNALSSKLKLEMKMLPLADLISVTTQELKKILLGAPYFLKVPIEVVPLAVNARLLPATNRLAGPLRLCYVGQLYQSQGIDVLLRALSFVPDICLKVVGGKNEEIIFYQNMAKDLGLGQRVHFSGFHSPAHLPGVIADTDIFVAPFEPTRKMCAVAHTKLMEYFEWKRPMLVPDLPVVREHFNEQHGVLFFEPGNAQSLAEVLNQNKNQLAQLQVLADSRKATFTWEKRAAHYKRILEKATIQ